MADERYELNGTDGSPPDDLDRLMARLESPRPPAHLIPTILAETVGTSPAYIAAARRMRVALWALYGVTLTLVLVCAVTLGQALHATGTLDVLSFAVDDSDLARQSPGLFWNAFLEHMPWLHIALLTCALAAWLVTAVALLRRRSLPQPPTGLSGHAATGAIR